MMEKLSKLTGRLLIVALLVLGGFLLRDCVSPETFIEYRNAVLIVFPILTVVFIFMNWDLIT